MAQGEDLQLKGGTSPKRGAEEGERAVRTGPKRRRLLSDNSQFTNLIRIYERHSQNTRYPFSKPPRSAS
jgi:hypothetical protein